MRKIYSLCVKLLNWHFVDFEECYDKPFQKKYGFYRPVVSHLVRKYLEFGELHQGFAGIKCPGCQHEHLLALVTVGEGFVPVAITKKWFSLGTKWEDILKLRTWK